MGASASAEHRPCVGLTIANGTSFIFSEDHFGECTRVTFSDTQITLTNLIGGIFPDCAFTGAEFMFLSGITIGSMSIGKTADFAGESIYLNVAAVPEPTTWALFGLGFGAVALRRRKVG